MPRPVPSWKSWLTPAETVDETLPDLFKPELFDAAQGDADDLTQIKGIGPKLSETLNELGVWHLSQIAAWTPENIGWLDEQLSFKGRIQRDDWVGQAKLLAVQPEAAQRPGKA